MVDDDAFDLYEAILLVANRGVAVLAQR